MNLKQSIVEMSALRFAAGLAVGSAYVGGFFWGAGDANDAAARSLNRYNTVTLDAESCEGEDSDQATRSVDFAVRDSAVGNRVAHVALQGCANDAISPLTNVVVTIGDSDGTYTISTPFDRVGFRVSQLEEAVQNIDDIGRERLPRNLNVPLDAAASIKVDSIDRIIQGLQMSLLLGCPATFAYMQGIAVLTTRRKARQQDSVDAVTTA